MVFHFMIWSIEFEWILLFFLTVNNTATQHIVKKKQEHESVTHSTRIYFSTEFIWLLIKFNVLHCGKMLK